MKNVISIFLGVLLFISCSKDDGNCRDEVIGLYSGSCTSASLGTFQGDMTISESSTDEKNVIIVDNMLDGGVSAYDGTLSSDCKTITIPTQTHIIGSLGATISGSFQINGTSLTGTLSAVVGSDGFSCTYNVTKR